MELRKVTRKPAVPSTMDADTFLSLARCCRGHRCRTFIPTIEPRKLRRFHGVGIRLFSLVSIKWEVIGGEKLEHSSHFT